MKTKEQKWLFDHTMTALDAHYDEAEGLIDYGTTARHDVRTSAHYALGLFERGDLERGCRVLARVMDAQFDSTPEDVFHGTFKLFWESPDAPHTPFLGEHFDVWTRYYLDVWQDEIGHTLRNRLNAEGFTPEQHRAISNALRDSILAHIPVVWASYDPNWREFVATTVSVILARHAHKLPPALHERIKAAMTRAVEGSIVRRKRDLHPMNTNIELMHLYICDFYGAYLQRKDFADYALEATKAFMKDFERYHTVAEFNSPTYYGVNFITFVIFRNFAPTAFVRDCAAKIEDALWHEVAESYHPGLRAICGPYSRSYELDLRLHTSFPSLFYVALGAENVPEPGINCELPSDVELALCGLTLPDDVKEKLLHFSGPHRFDRQFHELIERGAPDANRPLCRATGYLNETYMLGALSGSHNISHQLRPAVAVWRAQNGETAYMVLKGHASGSYRSLTFDAAADETHLFADVYAAPERDIEVFFEIDCPGATLEQLSADCFDLPGMHINLRTNHPVELRTNGTLLEAVYSIHSTDEDRHLHFELTFEPKA